MNWKITMLEIASDGLFFFALWIPFRMGLAGIRRLWCILTGWAALAGLMMALAFLPFAFSSGQVLDSDLANDLPDGQNALPFLLFGWGYAWAAAVIGRAIKKYFIKGREYPR